LTLVCSPAAVSSSSASSLARRRTCARSTVRVGARRWRGSRSNRTRSSSLSSARYCFGPRSRLDGGGAASAPPPSWRPTIPSSQQRLLEPLGYVPRPGTRSRATARAPQRVAGTPKAVMPPSSREAVHQTHSAGRPHVTRDCLRSSALGSTTTRILRDAP
jgi:hypothetical protein